MFFHGQGPRQLSPPRGNPDTYLSREGSVLRYTYSTFCEKIFTNFNELLSTYFRVYVCVFLLVKVHVHVYTCDSRGQRTIQVSFLRSCSPCC